MLPAYPQYAASILTIGCQHIASTLPAWLAFPGGKWHAPVWRAEFAGCMPPSGGNSFPQPRALLLDQALVQFFEKRHGLVELRARLWLAWLPAGRIASLPDAVAQACVCRARRDGGNAIPPTLRSTLRVPSAGMLRDPRYRTARTIRHPRTCRSHLHCTERTPSRCPSGVRCKCVPVEIIFIGIRAYIR